MAVAVLVLQWNLKLNFCDYFYLKNQLKHNNNNNNLIIYQILWHKYIYIYIYIEVIHSNV